MKRRAALPFVTACAALAFAALPSGAASQSAYLAIDLKTGAALETVNRAQLDTPILPGSVMKIVTIAAALESGVIGERTGILCTREATVAGHSLACTHPDLHRPIQAAEALMHSCNVFAATVASRQPRTAFDRALSTLALPPSDARWPVAATGLGVEGPRVLPRRLIDIVARIAAEPATLPWQPTTLRVIREGLRGAARQGTASALGERGVDALAKTGTTITHAATVGVVVGVTPSTNPIVGFVLVAPGANGTTAASLAADRLASRTPGRATIRVGVARDAGGYDIRAMDLEEYVAGVLAGEAARGSAPAALEALAIAVRTFALANLARHRADGFEMCDLTHCQVLRRPDAATSRAAAATAGQILLDHGRAAAVYYTASCGGSSERPSEVWPGAPDPAFLPVAKDEACGGEPSWSADLSAADLLRALAQGGFRGDTLRGLSIAGRDASGRVRRLALEGMTPREISGQDLRTLVGRTLGWQHIKSTAFVLRRTGSGFSFSGHGSGHGVGLCVIGSARLADRGQSVEQILSRYFPGLKVGRAAPFGPAREAGSIGSGLHLLLPEPDEGERVVIRDLADRTRQSLEKTLGISSPVRITFRFHPTVESYRRATGQPWFTSAATIRSDVHFVPLAILRQRGTLERTVRHELAHVLTAPALAGRPLWVHEGAAAYFAGGQPVNDGRRGRSDLSCPSDSELGRPISRDALGAAYARAARCFAAQIEAGKTWTDVR